MQNRELKQRQKNSNRPRTGQQQQQQQEEEEAAAHRAPRSGVADVKLSVSLVCLSLSVFIAWLHLQQGQRLAEISDKYERLWERSRGAREELQELEQKLQASALISDLRRSVLSVRHESSELQEEQDQASAQLHALGLRLQSLTGAWQSGRSEAEAELDELRTRARTTHTHVTESVNDVEGRLRALAERLQELEDGIHRNTRVLDRTEDEDAQRLRDELERDGRRLTVLQEQLQRLEAQGRHLWEKMDASGPHTQHWQDTHLPDAQEAVRSMLRVRAQMSATYRRLEELQRRCVLASAPPPALEALSVEVSQLMERFSGLTAQRQQLRHNLSALLQVLEDTQSQTALLSGQVSSRVASVRTDVRRMGGLEGEAEALLHQSRTLEERVAQAERLMVKRVGELLAGSIDRVSGLRSSAERSTQRLEGLEALVRRLTEGQRRLEERLLALESGQAKLLKVAAFAGDLKPKVFSIRQEFSLIEPRLDDLTLRIGRIAEDLMRREPEETSSLQRAPL